MIESASNTSRRRRQVWLARMRQRDACWVWEVTLKGSWIVSEPSPCGPNNEWRYVCRPSIRPFACGIWCINQSIRDI